MTKILKSFLTLLLLAANFNALALKTDRDQPIDIAADRLEMNDTQKISTYTGNVTLKQGSLNIHADTLTLYFNDANELDYMEMSGNPARLTQLSDEQKIMRGSAQKIIYRDKQALITLTHNAVFSSGKETITSHFIQINTDNEHIKAGKNDKKHRVRIKILPRNKNTHE